MSYSLGDPVRDGIPGRGIKEGPVSAAGVPTYAAKDAGQRFWLQLEEVVISKGYKLNKILSSMFALGGMSGTIVAVMSSNNDDLQVLLLVPFWVSFGNLLCSRRKPSRWASLDS